MREYSYRHSVAWQSLEQGSETAVRVIGYICSDLAQDWISEEKFLLNLRDGSVLPGTLRCEIDGSMIVIIH